MAVTTAAVIGAAAAVKGTVDARSAAKDSLKAGAQSDAATRQLIADQSAQAREDALLLFPAAEESRRAGFQGALDVFGQTFPQQLETFQQGNIQAQQAIAGGLPQIRNAILGLGTDFSAFQPQAIDFQTSFQQPQGLGAPVADQTQVNGLDAPPAAPSFLPEGLRPQSEIIQQGATEALGRINTDRDLFREAAQGNIPGLKPGEIAFFKEHLRNLNKNPETGVTSLIDDPIGSIDREVGRPGGFAPAGEQKLANLLTLFGGLKNAASN